MNIRTLSTQIYQTVLSGNIDSRFDTISDPQEHAFAKKLIFTALRKQTFLKKVIGRYSSKQLSQKLTIEHIALILGATEILWLNTPEYAVVSSYVDIAKKLGNKYMGGFVNAVLRKICQDKESILSASNIPFFSKNFRRILQNDYTVKQIAAIEKYAALEPPLDITVKLNPEQWAETLSGKLMPNNSVRIYSAGTISSLKGYTDGAWWVQDFASSLAVKALGNIQEKNVLDLCAAPGGKTAQLINAGALVTAVDISENRLQTLKENLNRLNFKAKNIICSEAVTYLQNTAETFDVILLDAPCSATGTLRRHPEIVHTKTIDDVVQSVVMQKQLLEAVIPHIKKGGTLLYSVCSLAKAEGEKQIADFITAHPDFKIVPVSPSFLFGNNILPEIITPEGFVRCLPSILGSDGGMDGFFIAKLQKE